MSLHKRAIVCVDMMNRLPQEKIRNNYCTSSPHHKIVDYIKVQLCVCCYNYPSPPRRRFGIVIAPLTPPILYCILQPYKYKGEAT